MPQNSAIDTGYFVGGRRINISCLLSFAHTATALPATFESMSESCLGAFLGALSAESQIHALHFT